jgi:hypothetical protein
MSKGNLGSCLSLALAFLLLSSLTGCSGSGGGTPSPPPPISWRGTQQFGTTGNDVGRGIALVSSTNIYITGSTFGDLDGNTSSGLLDIFLTRFDSSGNKLFTRQFGTTGNDIGYGVAVDSARNVYVTGSTAGTLGASAFGLSDVFLAKFDSSGNPLSIQQFGTPFDDVGYGIAVDSGNNVNITGSTFGDLDGNTSAGLLDIFLTKFDSSGNRLFTQQLGTPFDDIGYGVAVDSSNNAYITGSTSGNLDGNTSSGLLDIFLTKYNPSGVKQ